MTTKPRKRATPAKVKAAAATTVTAAGALTSTGSLSNPKNGDVLTYTITVTGAQGSISFPPILIAGISVPVSGGPLTFNLPEVDAGPLVSGATCTFVQSPSNPRVYTATFGQ